MPDSCLFIFGVDSYSAYVDFVVGVCCFDVDFVELVGEFV